MIPILQIGPISLPVPELIVLVGIWVGLNLAEKYSSRSGIHPNEVFTITLITLVSGLIGARISYFARFPTAFINNWTDLFSRNLGLLDPYAGSVAGIIVVWIYTHRKNINPLSVLDAFTPAFGVSQISIAVSHFASGEAFGLPTNLPWAIYLWGEHRHPVQIYEIVLVLILLIFLRPSRWWNNMHVSGVYFGSFISASAAIHLILGSVRADHHFTTFGLRIEQIVAWLMLATGMILIKYLGKERDEIINDRGS